MKKLLPLLAIAAVAATGCATSRVVPQSSGDPVFHVSEKTEAMKIAVKAVPADKASEAFAGGVKETAVTALRDRKWQVVPDGGKVDLSLELRARQGVFNNAADTYFTLDGAVQARLVDAYNGNKLAERTIRAKAGPEEGLEAASLALSDKVNPDVASWIDSTVTPDQVPIAASLVEVTRIDRHKHGAAGFVSEFVRDVSRLPGILRCETANVDVATQSATFSVVYRTSEYPQGLTTALVRALSGLDLELY